MAIKAKHQAKQMSSDHAVGLVSGQRFLSVSTSCTTPYMHVANSTTKTCGVVGNSIDHSSHKVIVNIQEVIVNQTFFVGTNVICQLATRSENLKSPALNFWSPVNIAVILCFAVTALKK